MPRKRSFAMAGGRSGRYAAEHAEASKAASPYDAMPIREVWLEYQKTRSQGIRNFLMEKFLPLVRYNAERVWAKLPDGVDLNDMISAGVFGLMDAIESFDMTRGWYQRSTGAGLE